MKKLVTLALLVGTAALTSAIVLKIKKTNEQKAKVTAPLPKPKPVELKAHGETGLSAERLSRLKAQLRIATETMSSTTPIVFEQFLAFVNPQKAEAMLETLREKGYTLGADGTRLTLTINTVADPQVLLNAITAVAHVAHVHHGTYHGFDIHPVSEKS